VLASVPLESLLVKQPAPLPASAENAREGQL